MGSPPQPVLRVDLRRLSLQILLCCLAAEAALLLLDYHVNYGGIDRPGPLRRLANIAREDGLASWFATVQTLLIGLTALAVHRIVALRGCRRKQAGGWLAVSLIFFYLAIDDGAQVHERVASAFDAGAGATAAWLDIFPSYTWQVLFLPLFGLLGLFLLVFLWRELAETALRAMLVTAMALLALAIGLDFIEGLDPEHPANLYSALDMRFDIDPWTIERFDENAFDALRHFGKAIEETLEMAAMSLLWFVLLRHLAHAGRGVLVAFSPER